MSLQTKTSIKQFSEPATEPSQIEDIKPHYGTEVESVGQSCTNAKTLQPIPPLLSRDSRSISNLYEGKVAENTKLYPKMTGSLEESMLSKDKPGDSELSDCNDSEIIIQDDATQTQSERRDEARRFYQSNKSRSLDWRSSRTAGFGNRASVLHEESGFSKKYIRRTESFEINGVKHFENKQESSVSRWIQAYNAASEKHLNTDRKDLPISRSTSLKTNYVSLSGRSLPARLKPRSEGTADQTGPCNKEETTVTEVTGNKTIMERIERLFKADAVISETSSDYSRIKSNNTTDSDTLFCKPELTESVFASLKKCETFPRHFSKMSRTSSGFNKLNITETSPSRFDPSELNLKQSEANKPSLSTDFKDASKNWSAGSSKSLEGSRGRFSAAVQSSCRTQPCSTTSVTSGWNFKPSTTICADEEPAQGLYMHDKKYVSSLQEAKDLSRESSKRGDLQAQDVHKLKMDGRRREAVLEKCVSVDSVKNTISMFESLAQQSKSPSQILLTRRAFSVPENPKPLCLRKSDSERNLNFRTVLGNPETITHLLNKSDAVESEYNADKSRNTFNDKTKTLPMFEPSIKMSKKSDDLSPTGEQWEEFRTKTDEPDSAINTESGLRITGIMKEKVGTCSSQSAILKQSNTELHDEGRTLANSPERTPLTSGRECSPSLAHHRERNTSLKPSDLTQSFTPIPPTYAKHNIYNNNNYDAEKDLITVRASMARWSSDEDDDDNDIDDTETEDSDSGESSVTITSSRSQSDRRSFSLSLVDLCHLGGVDNKPSLGNVPEDGDDWRKTRSASLCSDASAFSSVTLLSHDELDRLLDDVKGLGCETLQSYEDVQVVVLHKDVGNGLGFTLAGGVDQNKPVTVHRVIPGGVAAQEGSIFEGAHVLSINGTPLQSSGHWDALRVLRKARGQGMAVVVLQNGGLCETQNRRKETVYTSRDVGNTVRLFLNKSSSDLGFSLEGGVDSSLGDKPLTVKKIFQGGPITEVKPGDEILEIQGQSLAGMRRIEAWKLIKKLPPGPVEILLHRSPAAVSAN